MKLENFTLGSWKRLCSKHFLPEDYVQHFGKISLIKTAIPTVFAFPQHIQKNQPTVSRKRPQKDNTDDPSQAVIEADTTKVIIGLEDLPLVARY